MEEKYKWDGTDTYEMKNFTVALYSREIDILKRFDFSEKINQKEFISDELTVVFDLEHKGMIFSWKDSFNTYYRGTIFYEQIKEEL